MLYDAVLLAKAAVDELSGLQVIAAANNVQPVEITMRLKTNTGESPESWILHGFDLLEPEDPKADKQTSVLVGKGINPSGRHVDVFVGISDISFITVEDLGLADDDDCDEEEVDEEDLPEMEVEYQEEDCGDEDEK